MRVEAIPPTTRSRRPARNASRGEPDIEIAQLVLVGWIVGSIIAVGAVGVTLVYGILGVGDFAFGDSMTAAMFVVLFVVSVEGANLGFQGGSFGPLSFGWGLVLGLLLAIVVVVGLALVLERLVYRRLRQRGGGFFVFAIASLGIGIMIRALVQLIWGPSNFRFTPGIHKAIEITEGVRIKPDQIFIIGLTLLIGLGVYLLLYRTRFGKAMRATADNAELAEASGIRTDRVRLGTWALGGLLAALAGVMLGIQTEVRFDSGFVLLLPLFAAAILGGIGSPGGALVGGLVVGISQEVSTRWIDTGFKPAIPFIIVTAVLLLRPRGLFGRDA